MFRLNMSYKINRERDEVIEMNPMMENEEPPPPDESHFFPGQPDDKLAVLGEISVRVAETYCLETKEWLHDNLIEFYLEYLRHIKHKNDKGKIEIIGPTVSQCIKVSDCAVTTQEMIGPLNLDEMNVVLIPVNNANERSSEGTHWSLLVMIPSTERFYHLDTLEDMNKDSAKVLVVKLSNQLGFRAPRFFSSIKVRQDNAVDCGLYVLKNADNAISHFVRTSSVENFSQARKIDIANMRESILQTIRKVSRDQARAAVRR